MSIRHFQYGSVCLHFTRVSFNTGISSFLVKIIQLVGQKYRE